MEQTKEDRVVRYFDKVYRYLCVPGNGLVFDEYGDEVCRYRVVRNGSHFILKLR